MKRGYLRVSTAEQSLQLQRDALLSADCTELYEDQGVSGSRRERPELDRMLAELQDGDTVVVWRLDRLGRSMQHLLELSETFRKRNIVLRSLHESIDTSSATGRLFFSIMGALAEFERSLLIERTLAGMEVARRNGVKFGPAHKLSQEQVSLARKLVAEGQPVKRVARLMNVGERTMYRYISPAYKLAVTTNDTGAP